MKLNPDCVRDILLEIEDAVENVGSLVCFSPQEPLPNRLSKYSTDEIAYHLRQCSLSGLILGYESDMSGNVTVQDLSPDGHKFLSDIRSDTVWNHTKTIAGKIGAWSLDTLTKISVGVVTELIKRQLA